MTITKTTRRRVATRAVAITAAAPLMLTMLAMTPAKAAADRPPVGAAAAFGVDDSTERRADEAQRDAAIERLRADGMWSDEPAGVRAETRASPNLATEFGGRLLSDAFSYGVNWALDDVLKRLGLGSDADPFGKIENSIGALQSDVTKVMQMMYQLLHGLDKSNFLSSYSKAGVVATDINTAMRSVSDWVKYDLHPSEQNVTDMARTVNFSMGQLAYLTTDPDVGTIPLMMKATEAANVTDFDWGYYEQIDKVRDSYRTSYAQGLATMDMLVEWDRDGTIGVTRTRLVNDAVANTRKAYGEGIELNVETPTKAPVVQARNGDRIISAWKTPNDVGGNGWARTDTIMRADMEPILRGMADSYNPAQHGGVTLQKYLEDRNIPTSYVYYDSFHNHKQTTGGTLTRYISYELRAKVAEIRGNDYRERDIGLTKNDRAVRQDWTPWGGWTTDKESEKAADSWYKTVESHWKGEARQMTSKWTSLHDATSRLLVNKVQNNAGGWAADFDKQRVDKAAFPDA
jgi:hypothetical protein